jgi:hypothetical protein
VATAAFPRAARRSLLGKLAALRGPKARKLAILAAAVVREHATTVAALTAIDLGAFQAAAAAGWIVTGVSLLLLEFKIRD